jgi:hypothetical protein
MRPPAWGNGGVAVSGFSIPSVPRGTRALDRPLGRSSDAFDGSRTYLWAGALDEWDVTPGLRRRISSVDLRLDNALGIFSEATDSGPQGGDMIHPH